MKGRIVYNKSLAPGAGLKLYELVIYAPEALRHFLPGQFIMIKCGDDTTLRRPISVCIVEGPTLRICYDIRGKGTARMAAMAEGSDIDFIGPIGNGFRYRPGIKALLVGGGIGIYPLLSIGAKYGKDARALLGFRTASLINYIDVFEKYKISCSVITDDGSSGRKGFVTELLKEELDTRQYGAVYCCGPRAMMAGVALICSEYNMECQVSMEQRMGCGIGACSACVCRTLFNENGERKEGYKRVCIDGPVFDAKEINWSAK